MHRFLICFVIGLWMATGSLARAADDGAALPTAKEMERLAKENCIAFMEICLKRYDREVKGYSGTMEKQENIGGKIHPKEVTEIHFKEQPFSVYMGWREGMRKATRALYVEGENNGKMLARPHGKIAKLFAGDVVERDVDGADAKESGRYTLKEFGIKKGTERTHTAWKAAQEAGTLQCEYLGIKKVKEAGDRSCYAIRRMCKKAEDDGVMEVTIYVDTDNWLQVGSVLKDEKGQLIGAYYFRDLRLNPEFKKGQFQRESLK